MSDQRGDPRPSWKALVEQHGIAAERLARLVQYLSTLSYEDALQMVREARGTPERIDIALLALSRLAKVRYSRRNVGGFTFLAPEGISQTTLHLPLDTQEHYLNGLRAHGAVVQNAVCPPQRVAFAPPPAPYLVVSLPVGTLLDPERDEQCGFRSTDDLTAYFPDGYIMRTRITLAWETAYDVVLSHEDGTIGPSMQVESPPDPTV